MITTPIQGNTLTKTYTIARITGPGKIRMEEVSLHPPGKGEVTVKIKGCGLCASSIPLWEGREWFQYPLAAGAPGHEAWGVVHQKGDGVSGLRQGDRVAVLSGNALAEFRNVTAEECVLLPDALGDIPFPGEALGCAMNIFSRSRIQKDEVVSVIGSGFLGTMLIRLAKAAGARVFAFSRRESSLSAARDAGADEIISLIRENPQEKLAQFTDSKGCDCVIECAGKEDALNLAARLCGTRGRIVVAGYHQDGFRQVDMQLWNWKGLDIICAHERDLAVYRLGVEKAINAVLAGDLQPDAFYTHRFPFSELKEALELQAEAPEGFIKALVIFE